MVQNKSKDIRNKLEQVLGYNRVKTNFTMAPFSTFKIGGPAEYYFQANSVEDLYNAQKIGNKLGLTVRFFGGLSNVVISDAGISGLVVRNSVMYKKIIRESNENIILEVSSGYPVTRLVKETVDLGYSGLEYHLGLPGSLGGALYMNSKWTKPLSYVGDNLVQAQLMDQEAQLKTVNREYFNFGYDQSILQQTPEIVIWGQFNLKKEDPEVVKTRSQKAFNYRRQTQPHGVNSSGCFFRNIDGQSAGWLIDKLGLKGYSVGGVKISEKHANFIINYNQAKSSDVKKLVAYIKDKALKKYKIKLEEEVIFI